MKMSVFLELFETDIGFRNQMLGRAQHVNPETFSDLAFIAAVNLWKAREGGKKKAGQIHITFMIAFRGDKQPNPCVISPVVDGDPCVERVNAQMQVYNASVRQLNTARKEITDLQGRSGFSEVDSRANPFTKMRGGLRQMALGLGTRGRKADNAMFDEVIQVMTGPHTRLANFVDAAEYREGILDVDTPQVKAMAKLLGKENLEITEMGIY